MQLDAALSEVEQVKKSTREAHGKCLFLEVSNKQKKELTPESFLAAEALGHLERDLKQARDDLAYAEAQRQANQHVVTQRVGDVNVLRAENARQAQEVESLKSHLVAAEAKNRRMDDIIYGEF